MDNRQRNSPQMERERAVYDYLEALESGDIDGLIASLQRAVYDAPLDEMLADAHQAYFQDEQIQQNSLAEAETREMPALQAATLRSRGTGSRGRTGRRMPRWVQVLAAVLVLGVLVGSFVTVLSLRKGDQSASPSPTPTPVCQPNVLRQFNASVPDGYGGSLGAVVSISADDAWAVGSKLPRSSTLGTAELTTLIEHWNGKSWQTVQSPNGANGYGQLSAVAAVSANDVWAVGFSPAHTQSNSDHTLIEHWNGEKWQIVTSPYESSSSGALTSLTIVSANDIWAVGNFIDSQQITRPLLEHWNGSFWLRYAPSSGAQVGGALFGVAAISANDVWAVGAVEDAVSPEQGLIAHWDGKRWLYETLPGWRQVFSISAISADDLWITGLGAQGWMVSHGNGQGWQNNAISMPEVGKESLVFRQIHAISDNDIWAIGTLSANSDSAVGASLAVWHWNGEAWQQAGLPSQILSNRSSSFGYGIATSGSQQIWIVGMVNDSPLILGQRACSTH